MKEAKNIIRKNGETPESRRVGDRLFELTGHTNWFNPYSFPVAQSIFRTHLADCKNPRFLDLGCGNGEFARLFLSEYPNAQVVCVDANPYHIDSTRNILKDFPGRVEYLVESLEGLSEHKDLGLFDGIFAANVLHFINDEDLNNCLYSIRTLLKNTGVFLSIQQVSCPKYLDKYNQKGIEEISQSIKAAENTEIQELRSQNDQFRQQKIPRDFLGKQIKHSLERLQNAFLSSGFETADCTWRMFYSVMLIGKLDTK